MILYMYVILVLRIIQRTTPQAPTPTKLKNVFVMYSVFFVIMMCDL